ncbi:MAG: hypothetical protein N3E41_01230 [Thermofilaceae archaeon]|nr:hypothetical protein [Thermofilaceae archaeon]MDW8004703.1 hypothetical protein [Thermofilaceae archaeon]
MSVYITIFAVIALDLLERHELGGALEAAVSNNRRLLYIHIFKLLCEMSVIWLIVAFIGQIFMGWISL